MPLLKYKTDELEKQYSICFLDLNVLFDESIDCFKLQQYASHE